MQNILHLSLKKSPFQLMASGEKQHEFRVPSQWIKSRLVGREYDCVKFVNGYGSTRPFFIAEYLGYTIAQTAFVITYSTGFWVQVNKGDFIIKIGKITEGGNA